MTGFLSLDDLVLPPPLPAIVSVLLLAGVVGISEFLGARASAKKPAIPQRAAFFVIALGTVAALVHGFAVAHLADLRLLRIMAAALALAGCVTIARNIRQISKIDLTGYWRERRLATTAVVITVVSLFLAASGPVSDADSLDYHLGVPLDWLRNGGAVLQPHWVHARLTGLGEALNMLGLAAGTDGLGAMIQVSGLIIVMAVIASLGTTVKARLFGLLLALPPAILPLATAQKPQLFPAAAVAIAMVLVRTADSTLDFALIFGCVAFAAACKYSFLVSGGVVVCAAFYSAFRRGRLLTAVVCAVIAAAFFVAPVAARNLHLYGNPVSPFLETLKNHPDPEAVEFADYLQHGVGEEHTFSGVLRFVANWIVPFGFGGVQTILGIGVLALFFGTAGTLTGFGAVLLFTIWRGQMSPRYLLEPYFWCMAAVVASPWSKFKTLLFHGLTAQALGVAVMAVFAAVLLFPGALTPGLRESVMRRATFGYAESRWVNTVVPRNETMVSISRAYALISRPFIIPACGSCGSAPQLDLLSPGDFRSARAIVSVYPRQGKLPDGCHSDIIAAPERLPYAVRNPFNQREYQALVLRVQCQ